MLSRNQKEVCISPFQAPIKYGLVFPFMFILLLALLLAVVLWLDWRYGKRMLYFHITEREERRNEPLHVETEEQKESRLERKRRESLTQGGGCAQAGWRGAPFDAQPRALALCPKLKSDK